MSSKSDRLWRGRSDEMEADVLWPRELEYREKQLDLGLSTQQTIALPSSCCTMLHRLICLKAQSPYEV